MSTKAQFPQTPSAMRFSVIGLGLVGTVTCASLARGGHRVVAMDVDPFRLAAVRCGRSAVAEPGLEEELIRQVSAGRLAAASDVTEAVAQTDVTIVAVGARACEDGSISLDEVQSALEDVGRGIAAKTTPHVVVLRSTVPPGCSRKLAIPLLEHFSGRRLGEGLEYQMHPEFLRAGNALKDSVNPALIVIGEREGASAPVLRNLYSDCVTSVRTTAYETAEAVKQLSNAFHAVKITFANEAGAALTGIGVDVQEAFDLLCADSVLNIASTYLRPGFAFGGSCLPKDLGALLHLAQRQSLVTPFLGSLLPGNQAVLKRTIDLINPKPGCSIALLGLAFKPGTDDVRGSPFATLAVELLARGCRIAIFDPLVHLAWSARPDQVPMEYCDLVGLVGSAVGSVVASADIVILGHATAEHLSLLEWNLQDKVILDLRLDGHPIGDQANYRSLYNQAL
jgi:GDP-mannose 6-dehydrogenase